MSATTDSGTPPFSPCWPSGTRNCSSVRRLPRAQAVFVEEPVADIGDLLEFVADGSFELALGDAARALRRVIDDQRGAAYFQCSRRNAPAIDEHALDLGALAQPRDDVLGDLLGIGELRARRQFHRQQ